MARLFAAATRLAILSALLLAFTAPSSNAADAPAYKIVSVDADPSARKLTVRLTARMTEKAVKELAAAIAAKPKSGERIAALNFYLPGNELAGDPWATARTDGANWTVNVLGLRAEEEAVFRAEAETDARDVVGVWLTSPPALPGKLTIIRAQKGRFIAEWHLRSGQKTVDEVTMARVSRGYRYDVVGGDGAYYLAAWGGELLLGDATRVIAVAEKLVVEKRPAPVATVKEQPKLAQQDKDAAKTAAASATAAAVTTPALAPAAAPAKPRRTARASSTAKSSRNSVADLMGGSLAR